MVINFEFDFGDFGFFKAELECEVRKEKTPGGHGVSFKVTDAKILKEGVSFDRKILLAKCNDTFSAVHEAIADEIGEKLAQGEVA